MHLWFCSSNRHNTISQRIEIKRFYRGRMAANMSASAVHRLIRIRFVDVANTVSGQQRKIQSASRRGIFTFGFDFAARCTRRLATNDSSCASSFLFLCRLLSTFRFFYPKFVFLRRHLRKTVSNFPTPLMATIHPCDFAKYRSTSSAAFTCTAKNLFVFIAYDARENKVVHYYFQRESLSVLFLE